MLEASPGHLPAVQCRAADALRGQRGPQCHRLQGQDRPQHQPRAEIADQRAKHRRLCRLQPADGEHPRRLRRRGAQGASTRALSFLKEVDKRSGYRTKQMLVVPILDGRCCTACCRSSTTRATSLSATSRSRARRSCARRWPPPSGSACRAADDGAAPQATKYDGLVADGVLTRGGTAASASKGARGREARRAHADGRVSDHGRRRSAPRWPSSSACPTSRSIRAGSGRRPCKARSSASSSMEQGWIPLEEGPEGLVVMCLDPEAVRGSRIVPQVFPRSRSSPSGSRRRRNSSRRWPSSRRPSRRRSRSTNCWPTCARRMDDEDERRVVARVRGGRQRTGQVRQQGDHRRLPPEGLGHPHRAAAGQGQDRHPLPHRRQPACPTSRCRRISARRWSPG